MAPVTEHFKDGFEDDFNPWTGIQVVGEDNDIIVSGARAKVGANSALVHIEEAVVADKAKCYVEDDFSLGDGSDIWISAWLFFPTGFDCEQNFNLISLRSGSVDWKGFVVQMDSSEQLQIRDEINGAFRYQASPIAVPFNDWVGIEKRIYVHNSEGIVELWQDGNRIIEVTGIDTLPGANYADLDIGLTYLWGGSWTGPDDFWVDEVYVQDEQKILPPEPTKYGPRFNPLGMKRFGGL